MATCEVSKSQAFHYDKQTLLLEHDQIYQRVHGSFSPSLSNFSLNLPLNEDLVKLKTLTLVELNQFQAIKIVDLSPGMSNDKKLIYSTVISDVVCAELIIFVIEDELQNACRVSVPVTVNKSQLERGSSLVIINPFYQMASDGKYSLIVKDHSNLGLLNLKSPVEPSKPKYEFKGISEQSQTVLCSEDRRDSTKLSETDASNILTDVSNSIQENVQIEPLQKSSPFYFDSKFKLSTFETYTGLGNKLFQECRYIQAIVQFTCAIQANPYDAMLLEYRGMSYLKLGCLEDALNDFLRAKSLQPDSVKYQYLVAKIHYQLGNHVISLDLLKQIKPKENFHSLALENLVPKVEVFVRNGKGKFDFENLKESFNERKNIEIGDYIGPIRIRASPKHGRGLFTTRDVKKGENLCVTKAVEGLVSGFLVPCSCTNCRIANLSNDRITDPFLMLLIENLMKSKLHTIRFFSVFDMSQKDVDINLFSYSGYELSKNIDTSLFPIQKVPELTPYISLYYDHNRLDWSIPFNICRFIWLLPSLINHSCIPNAVKLFIGNICIVRAISNIPKGSEIFVSYLPLSIIPNVQNRSEFLRFKCDCNLCVFERSYEHKEEISQLIQLQFELASLCPVTCIAKKPDSLNSEKRKEKLNKKKWLHFKEKSFRLVKLLSLSTMKHQLVSASFQFIVNCLFTVSPNLEDAINLAVEAEPYFSELDPETYVSFWTYCNQDAKGNLDPENIKFKLIQNRFTEVQKLFF